MTTTTTFPKLSIVTPSYNQGQFLEKTIRSVIDQNYPNLEYILMDGGSTDGSVEIIHRYEKHFKYWQSQKDNGQNAAITDGFKHATGEIYAYLNSDDMYFPWAFRIVAQVFSAFPQIQWLTTRTLVIWDAQDRAVRTFPAVHYSRTWFYRGWATRLIGKRSGWIQQESTFWRRELWERAGACMDESLYLAGDFELWARFWQHANLVTTDVPLAGYRQHGANKSTNDAYIKVCREILKKYPNQALVGRRRKAAEQILRWTGRGGRRWGSTSNWLQYDSIKRRWTLHSKFVI